MSKITSESIETLVSFYDSVDKEIKDLPPRYTVENKKDLEELDQYYQKLRFCRAKILQYTEQAKEKYNVDDKRQKDATYYELKSWYQKGYDFGFRNAAIFFGGLILIILIGAVVGALY